MLDAGHRASTSLRFLAADGDRRPVGRTILREVWDDDDAKAYLGTAVPDFPNFFCLYGPNLQPGHGGSLLITIEVQVRYIVRPAAGDVRAGPRQRRVPPGRPRRLQRPGRRAPTSHMVWTHPGMSTYYRNTKGRIVVNSPWRNVDYWHLAREPDLTEYETEPRRIPGPLTESHETARRREEPDRDAQGARGRPDGVRRPLRPPSAASVDGQVEASRRSRRAARPSRDTAE